MSTEHGAPSIVSISQQPCSGSCVWVGGNVSLSPMGIIFKNFSRVLMAMVCHLKNINIHIHCECAMRARGRAHVPGTTQ